MDGFRVGELDGREGAECDSWRDKPAYKSVIVL